MFDFVFCIIFDWELGLFILGIFVKSMAIVGDIY